MNLLDGYRQWRETDGFGLLSVRFVVNNYCSCFVGTRKKVKTSWQMIWDECTLQHREFCTSVG